MQVHHLEYFVLFVLYTDMPSKHIPPKLLNFLLQQNRKYTCLEVITVSKLTKHHNPLPDC